MLLFNRKIDIEKFEKLQNRALRLCYNIYIYNRRDVSVSRMHADAKLLKLDTRRNIHLLNIMYDQRYNHNYIAAPVVHTRQALQINFRFDLVHSDIQMITILYWEHPMECITT